VGDGITVGEGVRDAVGVAVGGTVAVAVGSRVAVAVAVAGLGVGVAVGDGSPPPLPAGAADARAAAVAVSATVSIACVLSGGIGEVVPTGAGGTAATAVPGGPSFVPVGVPLGRRAALATSGFAAVGVAGAVSVGAAVRSGAAVGTGEGAAGFSATAVSAAGATVGDAATAILSARFSAGCAVMVGTEVAGAFLASFVTAPAVITWVGAAASFSAAAGAASRTAAMSGRPGEAGIARRKIRSPASTTARRIATPAVALRKKTNKALGRGRWGATSTSRNTNERGNATCGRSLSNCTGL
jgi:hypothetical protein